MTIAHTATLRQHGASDLGAGGNLRPADRNLPHPVRRFRNRVFCYPSSNRISCYRSHAHCWQNGNRSQRDTAHKRFNELKPLGGMYDGDGQARSPIDLLLNGLALIVAVVRVDFRVGGSGYRYADQLIDTRPPGSLDHIVRGFRKKAGRLLCAERFDVETINCYVGIGKHLVQSPPGGGINTTATAVFNNFVIGGGQVLTNFCSEGTGGSKNYDFHVGLDSFCL